MLKHIKKYFQRKYWLLGFCSFNEGIITGKKKLSVKYMKGLPKNKWYADPFILDITDSTIELLVEEYTYRINRGRIAHISVEKDSLKLLSEKIILDLPTHLSFPAIIRNENDIYIYPENSESNSIFLYKYDLTNKELNRISCIISEPLTDAIILNINQEHYIFSTKVPKENKNHLLIYKRNENKNIELYQEYFFDSNIARNAGNIIKLNNKYYRVAQDCSKVYGGGIIFQEIIYNQKGFEFKTINKIYPFANQFALHTFNTYKNICVIDVSKARFPIINSIINIIGKIMKKI